MEFWNKKISICLFAFILGVVLAEFLGRLAYRICKKEFATKRRLCCDLWGHAVLAALFVLSVLKFDMTPYLLLVLFLISMLYVITLTDLQKRMIPNRCLIVAVLVRILYFVDIG